MTAYGNEGRTGQYETTGVPGPATVAWTARTEGPVVATPVLAGGLLVVAAADGLYAFDGDTPLWRVPGEYLAAPVVQGDLVVVENAREQRVEVYDLRTGKLTRELPGGGCPTIVGDVLLLDDPHAGARAYRLPDLTPLWTVANLGSLSSSPAVGDDGYAYAVHALDPPDSMGGLTSFSLATGLVRWTTVDPAATFPCPVHPVYVDGRVWTVALGQFAGSPGTLITAFDPLTGAVHDTIAVAGDMPTGGVTMAGGTAYLATSRFDDDSTWVHAAGNRTWATGVDGDAFGTPTLAAGVLYVATTGGAVHALDAADGTLRWSLDVGAPIPRGEDEGNRETGVPVLPADGVLHVRTETGVTALRGAAQL